ncbi:uncharacterized protein LOC135331805 [Halichondria panicea]|uniref:uncharacterized protein LOC135331805 n=1 Tax=Halichondria panicea TaxID=6063 RepID=UPI00312B9992
MVRAWLFDGVPGDQRLPHKREGSQEISLEKLAELGVLYLKLDADNYEDDGKLAQIRSERGYNYSDQITLSPEKLPNYEQKIKNFFEEHLHADEEVRFIVDGSGYFDVRDTSNQWIRIELVKGDLITLPAGIYHRFTLDSNDYIKAVRLFKGEPVWTPINRPADEHPARVDYLSHHPIAISAK